jgi:hypothetical protein
LATIEEIKKSHVIYVSPIKCINVKKWKNLKFN